MLFWKDVGNGILLDAHSRSNYTRVTDRCRVLFPRCKKSGRVPRKTVRWWRWWPQHRGWHLITAVKRLCGYRHSPTCNALNIISVGIYHLCLKMVFFYFSSRTSWRPHFHWTGSEQHVCDVDTPTGQSGWLQGRVTCCLSNQHWDPHTEGSLHIKH